MFAFSVVQSHSFTPDWFASRLPWLLPGIGVALVVAIFFNGPVARWLGTRRIVAGALIVSTGAILSGTVTPVSRGEGPARQAVGACDLSRIRLVHFDELTRYSDEFINILLFIPLGFLIALVPRSPHRTALLIGAFALSFAIEATQLVVLPLRRGCESADVVDNLTGLALGFIAGTVLAWIVSAIDRNTTDEALDQSRST
jgi:hypothetical protein